MKQSVFKKDFSITGKNGTFTGSVVATLNYKTETKTGTHAVTHDEYTRTVPVHKVEAFINDKFWSGNPELYTNDSVLHISEVMINALKERLDILANFEPPPTFIEKMTKLFE